MPTPPNQTALGFQAKLKIGSKTQTVDQLVADTTDTYTLEGHITGLNETVDRTSTPTTPLKNKFATSSPTLNSGTIRMQGLATSRQVDLLKDMRQEFDINRAYVLAPQGDDTGDTGYKGLLYLGNLDWGAAVGDKQMYTITLMLNSQDDHTF